MLEAASSPLPSDTTARDAVTEGAPAAGYLVLTSGTDSVLLISCAASLLFPSIIRRQDDCELSCKSPMKKEYTASALPWPHWVITLPIAVSIYPPVLVIAVPPLEYTHPKLSPSLPTPFQVSCVALSKVHPITLRSWVCHPITALFATSTALQAVTTVLLPPRTK